MSDAVSAVTGVDAVALTRAASLAARDSIERRQRRLRWLASLRTAQGERDPDADAHREQAQREADRERIAAALGTIEEFGRLDGASPDAPCDADDDAAGRTITAVELARRLGADAALSLRVQAHLGVASVRRLVAAENATDAVNGL